MKLAPNVELQRMSRMVNRSKKLVDSTPYANHFVPMYNYLQKVHDDAQMNKSAGSTNQFPVDEIVRSGRSVLAQTKPGAPSNANETFAASAKVWGDMVSSAVELDKAVKMEQPKNYLANQLKERSQLSDSIHQLSEKIAQDKNSGDNKSFLKDQMKLQAQQAQAKALDEKIIAVARTNKQSISAQDINYLADEYGLSTEFVQQMNANPTLKDQAIMDTIHESQKQTVVQDSLDVTQKSLMAVGETLVLAGSLHPQVAIIGGIIEGISAVVGAIKDALNKKDASEKPYNQDAKHDQINDKPQDSESNSTMSSMRPRWMTMMEKPSPMSMEGKQKDKLDQESSSPQNDEDHYNIAECSSSPGMQM